MKKVYSKTERRGLPGGPNEFLQNITQYISVDGYKSDSPDVNNPFNIIESNNITMEGVDFPVRGYGNNGMIQDMKPGESNYNYKDADYVIEVPMVQDGIEIPNRTTQLRNFQYDKKRNKKMQNAGETEDEKSIWGLVKEMAKIPGANISNLLGILGVPANLIAEATEGITGRGDGEFNFMDAMPSYAVPGSDDEIFTFTNVKGTPVKNVAGLEDAEGNPLVENPVGAFITNLATDPSTYVGAGVAKNVVQKSTKAVPAIVKSIQKASRDQLRKIPRKVKTPVQGTDMVMTTNSKIGELVDKTGIPKLAGWPKGFGLGFDDGKRFVASARNDAGDVIDLNQYIDDFGNYYSFDNAFVNSPLTAGRTMRAMESNIPKYSIIKQNPMSGSLSEDSFAMMLQRLKNPSKFVDATDYGQTTFLNRRGVNKVIEEGPASSLFKNKGLFDANEVKALQLKYDEIFQNLQNKGLLNDQYRGLGTRGVKVPGIADELYQVGVPNISLQKLYKKGGSVSWQWKGKTYSGTLIPSMENEKNRYARTENGKIKTLPKAQDGGNVSDIWQDVTGTPWGAAKEKGLTDGSFDQNLKLRSDLLSDPNKFKPAPSNQLPPSNTPNASLSTLSPEEVNDKINSANDFNGAFAIARSYYGPNKIFEYNSSKYGTNLKGEEFVPSNNDMINAGLRQQEVKDIQQQNELVVSPYSSTDIVEIDEYENISDVKNRIKDYNKMSQADIIVNYQNQSGNTSPYVVVDKKAGLMHVYEPGNNSNEPRYSAPIDLGAVMSDAQTVTKYKDLNQDGIISEEEISQDNVDWSAGNKSTGAGRYRISNIDRAGYMGKPIFNFINESGEDVGTSMHAGFVDDDNNRVSNGCIRCNQATLDVLTNYLENSSEVFVLPEEEGNKFVYENGQLNFKQGSGKNYLTYTDETGTEQRGQGLNRTTNSLNYIPIKVNIDEERFKSDQFNENSFFGNDQEEYDDTVVPFAKSLQDNKQLVMKNLKINGDVYNDLAGLAFGIFGNETSFGETHNPIGNTLRGIGKIGSNIFDKGIENLNLPDSLKVGPRGSVDYQAERTLNEGLSRLGLANPNDSSMGLTQVRWNQIKQEPDLVESLSSVGITKGEDFDDPTKAALGTVAILAYLRNNRQGGNVPIEDLPRLYAGTSSTDPNRVAYTRNALNNAKYLNIKQKKYQKAGEVKDNPPIISDDVLLRQLFKESSFRPDVTSSMDARGVAQFRPITIKEMQRLDIVDENFDPYDLSQAIPAQRSYMEYLSKRPQLTQGSDDSINSKILFAYNRGLSGAVEELTNLKNKGVDIYQTTDWVDQINDESSDYIQKIYLKNNEKFNEEFDSIIQDPKHNNILKFFNKEIKMMGGDLKSMYNTYKHYINGTYTDSDTLNQAQKVYDKVNRLNYRRAKEANMSIPNYVMTHVIGNS